MSSACHNPFSRWELCRLYRLHYQQIIVGANFSNSTTTPNRSQSSLLCNAALALFLSFWLKGPSPNGAGWLKSRAATECLDQQWTWAMTKWCNCWRRQGTCSLNISKWEMILEDQLQEDLQQVRHIFDDILWGHHIEAGLAHQQQLLALKEEATTEKAFLLATWTLDLDVGFGWLCHLCLRIWIGLCDCAVPPTRARRPGLSFLTVYIFEAQCVIRSRDAPLQWYNKFSCEGSVVPVSCSLRQRSTNCEEAPWGGQGWCKWCDHCNHLTKRICIASPIELKPVDANRLKADDEWQAASVCVLWQATESSP